MKKTIIQGLIIVALFFSAWFFLSKIDWLSIFKIEKLSSTTEEKLGELFWEVFQKSEKENNNPFVVNSIDSLITKICISNKIDRETIKVHILYKDDINAFALPDGHLIIYTGLIEHSDNEQELCGVICHEIAHIQQRHVMKKLVSEIGLSFLISISTGSGGSETIRETAKLLSSKAFDRNLEKEADIKAVDYLVNAKINPGPFADFLYKLAGEESEVTNYFTWISTHPDSKERAEYIVEYAKDKTANYKTILTQNTWQKLKVQ